VRRIKIGWLVVLLSSCATAPPKEQGNLAARNAVYRGRWAFACRDLKAPAADAPLLRFTMQEPSRISDLRFDLGASPRYENYSIPVHANLYGPYKGEEVEMRDSPYFGANDFKITDELHLFLPNLKPGFEGEEVSRDRDSMLQNGAAEVAVAGQRYASIIHLRCGRQ
jgi:hypothetical protein